MDTDSSQGGELFQIVFFLLLSIPMGIISYKLAKEKGRAITLWTILGLIPVINFWCIPFFIGAANLKLESKIDELRRTLHP